MNKLTKIIATIGPASDSEEMIERLIRAGVNVFRFNMKHNVVDWHLERINRVQRVADRMGEHIGILVDLQGPEIRIETENEEDVELKKGETMHLVLDFEKKVYPKMIRIGNEIVLKNFEVGDKFAIEDGFFQFEVIEVSGDGSVAAKIFSDGIIKHRKGLNLIGKDVDLPSLIDRDLDGLDMATSTKVDYVALSFVRSANDIKILRREIEERKLEVKIIAKVESQKGLDNIDEIVSACDGIMIGRGDLGVETPIEKLNYFQKEIIKKCRDKAKISIVATQMLQSMVERPFPTRAEAVDVANAAYDRADSVMLSAETAMGKYPIEAVEFMAKIVKFNEDKAVTNYVPESSGQTHAFVRAGLEILKEGPEVAADKIVVITRTGTTAKIISSYRPNIPVLMVSNSSKILEMNILNFGLTPAKMNLSTKNFIRPRTIVSKLKKLGYLREGEKVLLFHRSEVGRGNLTNQLILIEV